jgi:hypothetical protein
MRIRLAPYGKRWKTVKKGDFVQKVWWFGDVWAEVLSVYDDPNYRSIEYAWADARSGHDSVYESLSGEWTRYFQVANVCTRAQLKKKQVRIVHTKNGAYGYDMSRPRNQDNPNLRAGWPKFLLTKA